MSNGSDQRIRHVAIVLQSLDAATSRGLLAQLPAAQSKLIRQALVNLGSISPQERAKAFESMQGLFGDTLSRPTPSHRTPEASVDARSPAAELLASQTSAVSDQLEWSPAALQSHSQPISPSNNEPHPNDMIGHCGSWSTIPVETLAEILKTERPIVIATVLNQVAVDRAAAIVQLLPIQVAGATLAAIPHLHLTDPAILRDIEQELERKIGQHFPPQATSQGLSKLQAILDGMPKSQKSIWENAVSQSNPVLASKLGWSSTPTAQGDSNLEPTEHHSKSLEPELVHPSSDDDVFDDSMVLPFPNESVHSQSGSSAATTAANNAASNDSAMRHLTIVQPREYSMDSLSRLSDRDFVTVLHACSPQVILLALSGAKRDFVLRVERLMPPKDVQRLRAKLIGLGPINLRDVDAAQTQIAETATNLQSVGKIGSLETVSFTAAA
ncbi:MAG: FliG C-terminal domain-containing protein [Pirellula sp.]